MSKKALVSLVLIGLMAFGAGLGTYAWFTSQATSEGNTFTAGELKVALGGEGEEYAFDLGDIYGNMQPGDVTDEAVIYIKNEGSLDLAWFGRFVVHPEVDDNEEGTNKLARAIYINDAKMEFLKPDGSQTWEPVDHFIVNGVGHGDWPGSYNKMAADDPFGVISLKTWLTHPQSNAMGVGIGVMNGALKPEYMYKFTFRLGFAPLAGNEFQGDANNINPINVKYVVNATQVSEGAIKALDEEVDAISIAAPANIVNWLNAQITKQN